MDEELLAQGAASGLQAARSRVAEEERAVRLRSEEERLAMLKDAVAAQLRAEESRLSGLRSTWARRQQLVDELQVRAGLTGVLQSVNAEAGQSVAAGIEVASGVLEQEARELNPGFIKRMEQGLPLVRVKMAMSLDGRTAMASGESQWITGAAARAAVQRLRARSSAILSGADTVLADNARLTVRPDELDVEPGQAALAASSARRSAIANDYSPLRASGCYRMGTRMTPIGPDYTDAHLDCEISLSVYSVSRPPSRRQLARVTAART